MKKREISLNRTIDKTEQLKNKSDWIILIIYIIALSVMTHFHELWFDEAQSWLIARDASIKDIIFSIPHYEGHPPLWHLYLIPFVKSGLPYEFGLKFAAVLINSVAVGLIIFKAPFHKIIRYTIPFTYYFFYEYGVISRCYSFTMLGFVLMAITYKDRNAKPFNYILSMMLVCASSAYGIVLCGGIAIVWIIEIIKEDKLKGFISRFIKDKRLYALASLLIFAIVLMILIIPRQDTMSANLEGEKTALLIRLYYMFVLAPLDASIFTTVASDFPLYAIKFSPIILAVGTCEFIIFAFLLYQIGKNSNRLLILIVPYVIFAAFSGLVYYHAHHACVITYFLLFWVWICFNDNIEFSFHGIIAERFNLNKMKNLKLLFKLFSVVFCVIPLYWNIAACAEDININYCSAKEAAEFIAEYELEDKQIMVKWGENLTNNVYGIDINCMQYSAVAILPYFDGNIYYNFNNGDDSLCYATYKIPTEEEIADTLEKWKEEGAPDVIIGEANLEIVFGDDITINDYSPVGIFYEKPIKKDDYRRVKDSLCIYMRNDLIDDYGLREESEYWRIIAENS